jgi:hypothetical protein
MISTVKQENISTTKVFDKTHTVLNDLNKKVLPSIIVNKKEDHILEKKFISVFFQPFYWVTLLMHNIIY